jgi:uncharacterized membrane protein YqaE (UPF0057 family)|tara:strand:+ start:11163 stop:11339 length:177 start_codon:yes stop_codon:yes gene_type:complete
MEILKKIFNSKKFWYTVGAIFVPFIAVKLGLTEAEVEKVYYAILTLILGQGIADISKK